MKSSFSVCSVEVQEIAPKSHRSSFVTGIRKGSFYPGFSVVSVSGPSKVCFIPIYTYTAATEGNLVSNRLVPGDFFIRFIVNDVRTGYSSNGENSIKRVVMTHVPSLQITND